MGMIDFCAAREVELRLERTDLYMFEVDLHHQLNEAK